MISFETFTPTTTTPGICLGFCVQSQKHLKSSKISHFVFSWVFPFCLIFSVASSQFLHVLLLFFIVFSRQKQTPKSEEKILKSSFCKNVDFLCENLIVGPRWTSDAKLGVDTCVVAVVAVGLLFIPNALPKHVVGFL